MDKTEYMTTLSSVSVAMGLLADTDIPAVLQAIANADAIGPIFNPTLWMEKHRAMDENKELLEAALPLWRMAQKLKSMEKKA